MEFTDLCDSRQSFFLYVAWLPAPADANGVAAQDRSTGVQTESSAVRERNANRITIEVTGGEKSIPLRMPACT